MTKFKKLVLGICLGLSLASVVTSADAYQQCRYQQGFWRNGYYHHGHRVCWNNNNGYYHHNGVRHCGWRNGVRVCWYN